jgi:hypothetical protein
MDADEALRCFVDSLWSFHKAMIQEATSITLERGELVIECPDEFLFLVLLHRQNHLRKAAQKIDLINRIRLTCPGRSTCFSVFYPAIYLLGKNLNKEASENYQSLIKKLVECFVRLCVQEASALICLKQCQFYQQVRVIRNSDEVVLVIETQDNSIAKTLSYYREVINLKADALGFPRRRLLFLRGMLYDVINSRSEFYAEYFMSNGGDNLIQVYTDVQLKQFQIRAQRHQDIIRAMGVSSVAVSLHDASDEGFRFLDLYASDPRRLNKPREIVIGQPASIVDSRISEPRIYAIRKALSNAQTEFFDYVYEDEYIWRFRCSVTPIYGTEEVIVLTLDAEDWQRYHWLNKL